MTFIAVNFDDAVEPTIAPQGRYELLITEAKAVETGPNSKNPGSPMLRVSIGFPENVEYQTFNHFIMLPTGDEDKKTLNNRVLGLKRFLVMFGVPFDNHGIDVEQITMEMVGCRANGEVRQTEPNADGNVYNSLVVPRIRD